ncbi:filamentous hemagglutinin outer membrane protein [Calothrix sp. NIES-2100]|uniref:two-partner secretion domain-containing protein n=1 Tax=Calothrix sp. NIES-2100 TaxID=1954172 RepID=UPI000B611BD9|nr:filamentous hemagglutinin outer membrane protein [Calothrix sp. NIES-2100]
MSLRTARLDWLQGLGITIVSVIALYTNSSVAQITPDGTLPNNSNVTLEGNTIKIEGGTTTGANLFHSFDKFSVPNGGTAFFNNGLDIQNILTRVTGNSISNIDGLIRANGTANLFLLNPNGIVFGQNARLNIGGSFSATTANSFKFPDGSEFSAKNPQAPPLLRVNITPGLQYEGSQPGATIKSTANLASRQDLTLVADKLDLQGQLTAGRNITLIGNRGINLTQDLTLNPINDELIRKVSLTTTSGDVTTQAITTNGGAIEIKSGGSIDTQTLDTRNGAKNGGAIALTANGSIDTGDLLSYSYSESGNAGDGGAIALTAKDSIDTGDLDSSSESGSGNAGQGGNITLKATNGSIKTGNLLSYSYSESGSTANGGNISLESAKDITTSDLDSSSDSGSSSAGQGGAIALTANGSIKTSSLDSYSESNSGSAGQGGAIALTAKGIIDTGNLDSYSYSESGSTAQGGNISLESAFDITTGDLDSSSDSGSGNASQGGAIDIIAFNGNIITKNLNSNSLPTDSAGGNGGAINLISGNGNITTSSVTGGKLTFFADTISSESGNFKSDDSLLIRSSSGGLATFVSKYGAIISANSNVDVAANYVGASLLVEATGDIRFQGDIYITRPDDITSFPIRADTETLSTHSALILRSGQSNLTYGGVNSGLIPTYGTGTVPSGITIGGDIVLQPFNGIGGIVSLLAASGDVNTQLISTNGQQIPNYQNSNTTNGGSISLEAANGSITTGDLLSFSYSKLGSTAQGGEISLKAANTIKITGNLDSGTRSDSGSAGNGGTITLDAAQDIIINGQVDSSSISSSDSGTGGAITLSAGANINTQDIQSSSFADSDSGAAGAITLIAGANINTHSLNSSSMTAGSIGSSIDRDTLYLNIGSYFSGTPGLGGAIKLTAGANINTHSLDSFSQSLSFSNPGEGGAITLSAGVDIRTHSLNSSSISPYLSAIGSSLAIKKVIIYSNGAIINTQNLSSSLSVTAGGGGAITLSAGGNINTQNLSSYTSLLGATGTGGTITLKANANIDTERMSSSSSSLFGTANQGGAIILNAGANIVTSTVSSSSSSLFGTAGTGGTITLNANANINIETLDSSSFSSSGTADAGGAITISAGDSIKFQEDDISAETYILNSRGSINSSGATGSGNIAINSNAPFVFDNGTISSDTFGSGKAGSIQISAPSISLTSGAQISASTHSTGSGGDITLVASDQVELTGETTKIPRGIFLQNDSFNSVEIPPGTFLGGYIPNGTTSQPPEGTVFPSGVFSQTTVGSTGSAGNLKIETGRLIINNGGAIATTTFGQNSNAGNISINADSMIIDNGSILSGVAGGARGNSGTIDLQTRLLEIKKGGIVQTQTLGRGTAGEITVNATEQVNISGAGSALRSSSGGDNSLLGNINSAEIGAGGDINLTTTNLSVVDNAVFDATTVTNAPGGNITLNSNVFTTTTGGKLLTSTSGGGNAGDIVVNVEELQLGANSGLFAETRSTANAGNLTIQPLNDGQNLLVNLEDGAQISAATFNSGKGGTLTVTAPESITIRGNGSIVSAETTGKGRGGDLTLDTGSLIVQDQAQVTVSSVDSGEAGALTVDANSIFLDNQGKIRADTTGGGGNIFLNSPFLMLRRGSSITTNASGDKVAGGNITIDAKNGFIIAVPSEDSDIRADSANFRGGVVRISNAAGIFGIQPRNEPSPNTSDITVKGATADLSGTIDITPQVDISRGLTELPIDLVDASSQISNACTPGSRQFQNKFVATGRGGLPIDPTEPLQDLGTISAWVRLKTQPENSVNTTSQPQATTVSTNSHATRIMEASGWVVDRNGNIELVAQAPQINPHSSWQASASCTVSQ